MRRYEVIFDSGALDDLGALHAAISHDRGQKVADAFIDRVLNYIEGFSIAPLRGKVRDEKRPHLRVTGWKRILTIIHVVQERSVVIVPIAYRGRDIAAVLSERAP